MHRVRNERLMEWEWEAQSIAVESSKGNKETANLRRISMFESCGNEVGKAPQDSDVFRLVPFRDRSPFNIIRKNCISSG